LRTTLIFENGKFARLYQNKQTNLEQ
jgi:hypothetical protein